MATIVEPPRSMVRSSLSPTITIPQRRRRESVEIIDLVDDDSIIDVDRLESPPRPAQRQRTRPPPAAEVIEILDSDDEFVAGPSHAHAGPASRSRAPSMHPGRRLFSPSPPPFYIDVPPPVPPLPRRYSGYAAFPPRPFPARTPGNGQPSGSRVPAPIRPDADIVDLSSSPPPLELFRLPAPSPPRAAPRARHNPPMGFGGALISANNARAAAERAERQRRLERRAVGTGRQLPPLVASGSNQRPRHNHNGFMARLASLNPFRGGWGFDDEEPLNQVDYLALPHRAQDDQARGDAELALDLFLQDQEENLGFGDHLLRFVNAGRMRFRGGIPLPGDGQPVPPEEAYKQEYTHPTRAEPGFVFDFEPSEIVPASETGKGKGKQVVIDVDALDTSSNGKVDALLVCARCLGQLDLRSDTDSEEERRKRRLWGLRCGHVLDGKCVEELWKPHEEEEADPVEEPAVKGKGKGKAKAAPVEEEDVASESDGAEELIPTSIRSRLRSSGSGAVLGVLPPRGTRTRRAAPAPLPAPRRATARTTRGKGKSKGSRSTRKPAIEARFEWTCPVTGCGRVHVSEKVNGVWGPPALEAGKGRKEGDAQRGPIGMFL
uniref:Uncharacterized protein n=1 Tax=Mycena chlorophos TaxID=658473 RepID=A0ABQ0LGJ2_MYCCL|nr:predicted protein [Mycena chlorophos]